MIYFTPLSEDKRTNRVNIDTRQANMFWSWWVGVLVAFEAVAGPTLATTKATVPHVQHCCILDRPDDHIGFVVCMLSMHVCLCVGVLRLGC